MPPPKSGKLQRDENEAAAKRVADAQTVVPTKVYSPGEEIPIKKVKTYNDFVAILQFRIDTGSIIVGGDDAYQNEGMVVGTGDGLPNGGGTRCPSQLQLGDVVAFYGKPTTTLNPTSGIYAGQRVVIVPERSVMCGLKPLPFKIVESEPANG